MKAPGLTLKYFNTVYVWCVVEYTSPAKNSEAVCVNFSLSFCFYLEFYATKIAKPSENLSPEQLT